MIDEELRSRGLTTIVDTASQHLAVTPQYKMKIYQNIDDCESILIFVTSKFMGKVNGMDGNNDICKTEYDYALRTASSKLVIVILEERMKVLSQWKGALRYVCCAVDIMLRVELNSQYLCVLTNPYLHFIHSFSLAQKMHRRQNKTDRPYESGRQGVLRVPHK